MSNILGGFGLGGLLGAGPYPGQTQRQMGAFAAQREYAAQLGHPSPFVQGMAEAHRLYKQGVGAQEEIPEAEWEFEVIGKTRRLLTPWSGAHGGRWY